MKVNCDITSCVSCDAKLILWLDEEAEEEQVDWSNVPVDTKIWVKDLEGLDWIPRYFANYKKGKVYAFAGGATSWSNEVADTMEWKYAKLAEEEADG